MFNIIYSLIFFVAISVKYYESTIVSFNNNTLTVANPLGELINSPDSKITIDYNQNCTEIKNLFTNSTTNETTPVYNSTQCFIDSCNAISEGVSCHNETSCCYYNYTFNTKQFKKCERKKNWDDNYCKYLVDVIAYYGGEMVKCSCQSSFITTSFLLLAMYLLYN